METAVGRLPIVITDLIVEMTGNGHVTVVIREVQDIGVVEITKIHRTFRVGLEVEVIVMSVRGTKNRIIQVSKTEM